MGAFSVGRLAFLLLLLSATPGGSSEGARIRRDNGASQSLLTVEWEGIQTGDHPDDSVGGFAVEYRAEKDTQWHVHDGIIPYRGPNLQYRVQIPRLPTGIAYFVRIKVLGKDGTILVETPEIRARNEMVSIKCESDDLTAPKNLEVTHTGQYNIALSWEPPECGSVGEYHIELSGVDNDFDIHRQTVTHPTAIVTNLLPGASYRIRIRAADRSRTLGPWIEEPQTAKTQGDALPTSEDVNVDYRSDNEIRIHWPSYDDERLQYYEVMAVEKGKDAQAIERIRMGQPINSIVFNDLKPNKEYMFGVVPYVDHEPRKIYRTNAYTAPQTEIIVQKKPEVQTEEGTNHYVVRWKAPEAKTPIKSYVIEYRLPNETDWREYESVKVDSEKDELSLQMDLSDDDPFFSLRILAVDNQNIVASRTEEITIGSAALHYCVGEAGIPKRITTNFVSENTMQFSWDKPECDESYGPIDGYEYVFWNVEKETQPKVVSYVGRNTVTIDKLDPDSRYAFRVRSRAGNGHSAMSDIVYTTTKEHSGIDALAHKPNKTRIIAVQLNVRQRHRRQQKYQITDERNIYQLRIVLSPPISYLVWTPLSEHAKLIKTFRLSYKQSASDDWTIIDEPPEFFRCPPGVADPEDYCYELSNLAFGVQYTADISYILDTGEKSPSGSPIFFILVEAGQPSVPSAPHNLQITPKDSSSVELRWLPPLSSVHILFYQITIDDMDSGQQRVERIPGTYFSYIITDLSPYSSYNISVRSVTDSGELGPPATGMLFLQRSSDAERAPSCVSNANRKSETASTETTSVCGPPVLVKPTFGIESPRIEQQGSAITVYWTVGGDSANVLAYNVEIRSASDGDWRQYSGPVRHSPSERHYRQQLNNLDSRGQYFVRVSAIDKSHQVIALSPTTSFMFKCQFPAHAPEDLRMHKRDDGVYLSWRYDHQDDPSCQPFFLLSGTVNGVPINERIDAGQRQYKLENAVGDIILRLKACNEAGLGPSSQPLRDDVPSPVHVDVRVPRSICDIRTDFWCPSSIGYTSPKHRRPDEALISTPRVTPQGGDLRVDWQSQGNGRDVFGYRIQFRSDAGGWNPYGQLVPYVGDGQLYTQVLTGLQLGRNYHVQIQVLDRNSYVMYTSPEVMAQTTCVPPSHPPSHVQLQAPDPQHVRVSWTTPPQSTWGCDHVALELQVDQPPGQRPVFLDNRQNSYVFDAQPDQLWSVRVRTKNPAGVSAWSQDSSVRTPPVGELIIGPTVSYRQGIPSLSWNSKERVDDFVSGYRLESRSAANPNWMIHGHKLPYMGWQRPYSIELSGLIPGELYQFRVLAEDSTGKTVYESAAVNVQTQPQCSAPARHPLNVQVTPIGPTQIRVSWTPLHESEWNCDRIWYVVKYSSDRNQGFLNITSGENSVILESEPFTRWNIMVQAANPYGESRWSTPVDVQTQATAPGKVSDLQIYPQSPSSIQLFWRPPQLPNGRISGYEITYQLLSKGMCDKTSERPVTVTCDRPSFILQGLYPHSKYRISVAAKTTIAGEPYVTEIETDEAVPTAPPAYIRASNPQPTEIDLDWQGPPCLLTNGEITEYEYEVRGIDPWAQVGVITNTIRGLTRTKVTDLKPFTRYNVRMRAYTKKGPGPWSEPVEFQTASARQSAPPPSVNVITTNTDKAHVVWQEPYPPQGYIDMYRCRYGISGQTEAQERQFPAHSPCSVEVIREQQLPAPPPGSQLHCGSVEGLQRDAEYDFKVAAHVRGGEWSSWSPPARGRISEGPVEISSLSKTGGTDTTLNFAWQVQPSDLPRVTGYTILVVPLDRSLRPQMFSVDRSITQYQIDNLRPDTRYNITVGASTKLGGYPGRSMEMQTDSTPLTGLSTAPRILDEQATSVKIGWFAPPHPFQTSIIEYRINSGAWQRYNRRIPAVPGVRDYSAIVDGLPTNAHVEFRVRVTSPQGLESPPSSPVTARTKCSSPSAPPHAIRLDAPTMNEVRVSWARPAKDMWQCDQLHYEVSFRTGDGQSKTIHVPADQTEYVIPSEPNTRWVIKMRSTNQVGSSPWSAEQSITTRQGAPGSIRDLRLRARGPNEVHAQWLAPLVQRGTIVGYDISYRLKHRLACPDEEPRDVSRDFITVYNHKDLEYTLTGLLPFSLYEVRVRARTTELGPEEVKEITTEQQPPSAPPLNLQLGYALERSLSFHWEPVECSQRHGHITSYEYEILGQDDWAKLERQIANTTDTKITIEGLTPYTKYVMRIKAYNSIGGGPNTENLDVMTVKANAPLPPQDLVVAQEGTNSFLVSWLPPYPPYGPHDSYKLRYQPLSAVEHWTENNLRTDDPRLQCPQESPRFCYNITGLESGQQYRVQVAAHIEGKSFGPWSSVIIANTLQVLPDALRAIELIEKTDHSLNIRWVPPPDPLGYITQYRLHIVPVDEPHGRGQSFLVSHPTLQYIFDNLKSETTYNVSIAAGTKRGFGPVIWTQYSTKAFQVPSIKQPPELTPVGPNGMKVHWQGVADIKNRIRGYIIEIRSSSTPTFTEYGQVIPHDALKGSYETTIQNLDPDMLYVVRIKVVDHKDRVSEPSPESTMRTGCARPTAPPTNFNAHSPSPFQVRLNWLSPPQSSWLCSNIKYRLEYTNGSAPPKQIELPSGTTEHVFDSAPNTQWRLRARLENEAGASDWSKELVIKTLEGAPGTVEGLNARGRGPTSASVTWEPPRKSHGDIAFYSVTYQLLSRGQCGPRSSQPTTKTVRDGGLTLDGLLPDSTYQVRVTAHTNQPGAPSEPFTFTTEEAAPTGPPTNVRMRSVTQRRADMLWNEPDCELANGDITGYDYAIESLDEWGENKTGYSAAQRVTMDELVPYTRYRARVRAQNKAGSGPYSDWTTFQTLPAAPTSPNDLVEEQQFPHAVEISFLPPYPPNGVIDKYRIRHTPTGQMRFKEVVVPEERLRCSDASKKNRLCARVVDLEPEHEYEIQVAAHVEGANWGPWSETLVAKTNEQTIPVLERELQLVDTRPTSISMKWRGLEPDQAQHMAGYILEYKSEDDDDWKEYNGIVRHRSRQNEYKQTVRNLDEAKEYFFRLRVVGKNDKRGSPGPELKAVTNCGRPQEAPSDIQLESVDFEAVRLSWKSPDESTWKCGDVEYVVDFVNTTSRGMMTVPSDSPGELILETVPGTKWEIRMRTQTVEDGDVKPQHSSWSDRASLVTQALPGELFVKVEPKTPTSAMVNWDLADQDQKWNYGVDIAYKLLRLGGCDTAPARGYETITKYGVEDKRIIIDDLKPGSEYEVIVTPRKPPTLHSAVSSPKTVRKFRTETAKPSGAPENLRSESRKDTELSFKWEPPKCADQNGRITQYEYELVGAEDWNTERKEGVTPRTKAMVSQLKPGSMYNARVRAYTAEGPGPWSEVIQLRTTGTEIGAPRELIAVETKVNSIRLTWLPPYPETVGAVAYKVKYSPHADDSNPVEVELSGRQLSCLGYSSPLISKENLCTEIENLQPDTTYRFTVQGLSPSGNWGPWSAAYFASTRKSDDSKIGGILKLVSAGSDNLRVNWTAPDVIRSMIDQYQVGLALASDLGHHPKEFWTPGSQTSYHFRGLEPVTHYNVTVQGLSHGKRIWFKSEVFATTDFAEGLLTWLPAPTDLELIEKSDRMLHVMWNPPEVFNPQYKDMITHYRVTITPFDSVSGIAVRPRNYTVPYPGNSIKFTDLEPETIYNITVQAGTDIGYGDILWGTYSTLAPWERHILRLVHRTPTSLKVEWEPVWGTDKGYLLTWKSVHSALPHTRINIVKSVAIDGGEVSYTIDNLNPSTVYNVTLQPKGVNDRAWGAYATLPPGWFLVRNLKTCDRTDYAASLSWEPVGVPYRDTLYQIRYMRLRDNDAIWQEEPAKTPNELLCPKDGCNRLCYLIFNMETNPSEFVFQVRTKVDGVWNQWKTAGKPGVFEPDRIKASCCIVAPPYRVEHIGEAGTFWEVDVAPAASQEKNISRYYVVVDERHPAGDTNWTELTDKVTAAKNGLEYYVAASFIPDTLKEPTKVKLGNGSVIGGYLNYPLVKGKKYNYEVYSVWQLDGKPLVGRLRASPYTVAGTGWPWWWLLLLLLLLLLLIFLCCCLLWCLQGRWRRRKEFARSVYNGQTTPLITGKEDELVQTESATRGDRIATSAVDQQRIAVSRGDFEDGYVRGFKDASKLGSASAARRRMDDEYGSRDDRFHEGYVKGLRDAGMTGMSSSMYNLAQRGVQGQSGRYSDGYMQGFRDGNSGSFGDRISTALLRRLEEHYPNQDDFRAGYIEGFKEGAGNRVTESRSVEESRKLQQSLTELTERLLEKSTKETVGGGGDVHTTKIYHVYNQAPEGLNLSYTTQTQALAQELDELTSSSRRSTLRRHYTPGDYLKYGSEGDGYGSLSRNRRSLSASALAKDSAERSRYLSGTGTSYISRASAADRSATSDTFSRRYNYRSRSDMGSPRRYASQTLLDGSRPGPSAPHVRRDALHTLQRELDTLSPDRSTPRGYSSDTGYVNDTYRSRARGYSNYDYEWTERLLRKQLDSYSTSRSATKTSTAIGSTALGSAAIGSPTTESMAIGSSGVGATSTGIGGIASSSSAAAATTAGSSSTSRYPVTIPVRTAVSSSYSSTHKDVSGVGGVGGGGGGGVDSRQRSPHDWPDDLIDIVNEPMGQTLDRMKRYSNSMSHVDHGTANDHDESSINSDTPYGYGTTIQQTLGTAVDQSLITSDHKRDIDLTRIGDHRLTVVEQGSTLGRTTALGHGSLATLDENSSAERLATYDTGDSSGTTTGRPRTLDHAILVEQDSSSANRAGIADRALGVDQRYEASGTDHGTHRHLMDVDQSSSHVDYDTPVDRSVKIDESHRTSFIDSVDDGVRESVEERYHRSYKEEYSTSGR